MKIRLLAAASIAALTLAGCSKQQPSFDPAAPGCLQYSLGAVTLSGQARTERISAPDKDYRQALVMTLDQPICVSAKPGDEANFPAQSDIREIELVPQSDFADAFSLAGSRVTAHGNLAPLSGDGAASSLGLVLRTLKADE